MYGREQGQSFDEWRKQSTDCDVCGKVMKKGSLKRHMDTMHGATEEYLCREVGTDATFWMDVERGAENKCPVDGCIGGAKDKFGMYRHFSFRHPESQIVIRGDGIVPKCDLRSI